MGAERDGWQDRRGIFAERGYRLRQRGDVLWLRARARERELHQQAGLAFDETVPVEDKAT